MNDNNNNRLLELHASFSGPQSLGPLRSDLGFFRHLSTKRERYIYLYIYRLLNSPSGLKAPSPLLEFRLYSALLVLKGAQFVFYAPRSTPSPCRWRTKLGIRLAV